MAGVNVLPDRLNSFKIYADGSNDLKGIADLQLPSISMLTETITGAGISGELELPLIGHTSSMKFTMNWRTMTTKQLDFLASKFVSLDCRGAFQEVEGSDSSIKIVPVKVFVKGVPTTVDIGRFTTGSTTDGTTELEVSYLKILVNGKEKVEIDKLNFIYRINGVDYLKDIRSALGM